MAISDFLYVFEWWSLLLIIGALWFPLTKRLFPSFVDKGYLFSKILGTIAITYVLFILGIFNITPFDRLPVTVIALLLSLIAFAIGIRQNKTKEHNIKLLIFEEALFFAALLFWSFIRAHQPDIHGLEKYMDFGFVNSILRSKYFPPVDMWFPPLPINYYYFGHLFTAVLTRISNIPSFISFNLMIATLFATCLSFSFSLGINLSYQNGRGLTFKKSIFAGAVTSFLLTFGGSIHTLFAFFKPYVGENPTPFWQLPFQPLSFPNLYWYPNATRFIYHTIHEFPLYSFVVSDLHGHVLDIPIVLAIIAFLFQKILLKKATTFFDSIFIGFLLAIAYMTNAWDGPIYFLLTFFVYAYIYKNDLLKIVKDKNIYHGKTIFLRLVLVLASFFLLSLPFNHFFKPFTSGIGVLCAPEFLTNLGRVGPFLFEPDHCMRSPFWQLIILWGFFYFWAISLLFKITKEKENPTGVFLFFLSLLSTALIIIPEFFYLKDIYPAHYRANTMFKLVYQSFMMLALVSGYSIFTVLPSLRKWALGKSFQKSFSYLLFFTVSLIIISLVSIYPFFAVNSYYSNLKVYSGLDGIAYLKYLYPSDYNAIMWINKNISGQPVMLEAQGESYTDFNRISANTGLPTILGWTVHEWLWRGSYNIDVPRIADVETIYESPDLSTTKSILDKYNVAYIYIGLLEKQKYQNLQQEKLENLGKIVFQDNGTKIIKVR